VRLLVAFAAMAVPLVGASAAQAALAGANPLTTTNRPDLRTVTLTGTSTAQFCFDQTVAQVPSQSAFSLGGYRSDNFLVSTNPTAIDSTNNKCVNATFPISIGDTDDLTQFTIGQVGESAVLAQVGSGFVGNRSDSTTLSGSNTHNGTAGHTTAPDLTGVVVDNVNTGNTLDYIYDQNVQISSVDATKFRALYQDGTPLGAVTGIVAGGNVAKVTFATPLSDPVHGPAVIAISEAAALKSQTADHTVSSVDSQSVAGTAGATTTKPDLIAGQLASDGTFVDYTFDKPLGALPSAGAAGTSLNNFEVALASGFVVSGASCVESTTSFSGPPAGGPGGVCAPNSQLPNNTVRAFFLNPIRLLPAVFEYAVKADVLQAAPAAGVQTTALVGNDFGEVPIGDNQGAFAAGFTTGPDVFRVTFDAATNTAAVLFDQRVFFTTPSSFVLLDANGTPLPGGVGQQAGPVSANATTPGSYVITVSFTGASVAGAKALEIKGPQAGPAAASTHILFGTNNVQQIVSPTGAAAVLKRGAKVHWVRVAVKKHKKHSRH
jgi:hypothetical protein